MTITPKVFRLALYGALGGFLAAWTAPLAEANPSAGQEPAAPELALLVQVAAAREFTPEQLAQKKLGGGAKKKGGKKGGPKKLSRAEKTRKDIDDTTEEIGKIVKRHKFPKGTDKEIAKARRKVARKIKKARDKILDDWVELQKYKLIKQSPKGLTVPEIKKITDKIYAEADKRVTDVTDKLSRLYFDEHFNILHREIAKTNPKDAARLVELRKKRDDLIFKYNVLKGGSRRTGLKPGLIELPGPGPKFVEEAPKIDKKKVVGVKTPKTSPGTKVVPEKKTGTPPTESKKRSSATPAESKSKTSESKGTPGNEATSTSPNPAGSSNTEKTSTRYEPSEGLDNSGGGGCFTGDTLVRMADGSLKAIKAIEVGDRVIGVNNSINTVQGVDRHDWGGRKLYGFNGSAPFITGNHPVLTAGGWKAVTPARTASAHGLRGMIVLKTGAGIVVDRRGHAPAWTPTVAISRASAAGWVPALARLERLESTLAKTGLTVFNLRLDGSHTYFANGYLAHNEK